MVQQHVDPLQQATQAAKERRDPGLKPPLTRQELADALNEVGRRFDVALAKKVEAKDYKAGVDELVALTKDEKRFSTEAEAAQRVANEALERHLHPERFTGATTTVASAPDAG